MKILVTGASGRIGISVLREIHKLGLPIRILDKCSPPQEAFDYLEDYVEGNILDYTSWQRALSGVDVVIHLAAVSRNTSDALRTNLVSTHMLAYCAAEQNVRKIVFASSNCVVGHCDMKPCSQFQAEYFPIDEAHPFFHEADYGLSKYLCEKVLEAAVRKNQYEVIALRLGWVWSESQCAIRKNDNLIGENTYIDAIWNYIHEEDCAAAFRLAITKTMPSKFEVMYISAQDTLSSVPSRILADKYFSSAALPEDWKKFSFPSFFSWRKAKKLLGYEPMHSWRE